MRDHEVRGLFLLKPDTDHKVCNDVAKYPEDLSLTLAPKEWYNEKVGPVLQTKGVPFMITEHDLDNLADLVEKQVTELICNQEIQDDLSDWSDLSEDSDDMW